MKKYIFIYRNHKPRDCNPYNGAYYSTPELQIYAIENLTYCGADKDKDYIPMSTVLTVTAQTTVKGRLNPAYGANVSIEPCRFNFNSHKAVINKVLSCGSFNEILELVLRSKQFTRYMYKDYDKVKYTVKR